ncbi:MAG: ATP-binding protein [Thermoguttaceae bacterium]
MKPSLKSDPADTPVAVTAFGAESPWRTSVPDCSNPAPTDSGLSRAWRVFLPTVAILSAVLGVTVAITARSGGRPWPIAAFGLGFTSLLAAYFLSIADRVAAVRRLVAIRTQQWCESHRQLQEAQQLAHLGSWEWDFATGTIVWSDEEYRLLGFPQDSTPSINAVFERVHPDDRPGVLRPIRRALVQGPCDFNHRIVLPDGTIRFLHELGLVTFDDSGKPCRMTGTTQDVTAVWRVEQALRENEEKLRMLTANLPGAIYQFYARPNGEMGLYHVDGLFRDMLGSDVPPAERYQRFVDGIDARDRQRLIDTTMKAVVNVEPWNFEGRFVKASGETIWFRGMSAPTKHADEIVFNGILLDIDQRKRTEEALARSEERYRSLFHQSPIALREDDCSEIKAWIDRLRADGVQDFPEYIRSHSDIVRQYARKVNVLDLNQAMLDLHGAASKEEFIAGLPDIVAEESYEAFCDALAWIAEGRTTFDRETPIRTLRGEERQILLRWAAAPGCEQSLARVYISQIDITDRRRAERELQNYADALRATNVALEKSSVLADAANRAKSEFLANMSHEIRTPMTAILGYADLLAESGREPALAEAADTIRRNGCHLLDIINNILDISKIEAGKLEVEPIACSPSTIVSEVASLMRLRAEAKRLSLSVEFDGPIPETIHTDPVRLRQILINLIGNAVKFTEAGGVRVVARLRHAAACPPLLQFDVIDTGIGMTPQQVGQLFEPFMQADTSTSRRFGGSGLGLTISKRLAELLGGDIRVESTPARGTTFSATINPGPLNDAPPHLEPSQAKPLADEPATCRRQPPPHLDGRVLLVEDGPDNQRLIALILRTAGAEVTVAANGQEAIADVLAAASADGNRPHAAFDVILMDMQMPVLDGYAATAQLRSWGYRGPIIALTAHAMTQDRQKCLDAGCDDYLAKPIDRQKILDVVRHYMPRPAAPATSLPSTAAECTAIPAESPGG